MEIGSLAFADSSASYIITLPPLLRPECLYQQVLFEKLTLFFIFPHPGSHDGLHILTADLEFSITMGESWPGYDKCSWNVLQLLIQPVILFFLSLNTALGKKITMMAGLCFEYKSIQQRYSQFRNKHCHQLNYQGTIKDSSNFTTKASEFLIWPCGTIISL